MSSVVVALACPRIRLTCTTSTSGGARHPKRCRRSSRSRYSSRRVREFDSGPVYSPDLAGMPRILDLRSARRLAALGLDLPAPGRRMWSPYQDVGETLWRDGWMGLITRSAARPDAFVVCVFADEWPPHGCAPRREVWARRRLHRPG